MHNLFLRSADSNDRLRANLNAQDFAVVTLTRQLNEYKAHYYSLQTSGDAKTRFILRKEAEIEALQSQQDALKAELADSAAALQAQKAATEKATTEKQELDTQLAKLTAKIEIMEEIQADADIVAASREKVEEADRITASWRKCADDYELDLQDQDQEGSALKVEVSELKATNEQLKADTEAAKINLETANATATAAQTKATEAQAEAAKLRASAASESRKALRKENEKLATDLATARSELEVVKELQADASLVATWRKTAEQAEKTATEARMMAQEAEVERNRKIVEVVEAKNRISRLEGELEKAKKKQQG